MKRTPKGGCKGREIVKKEAFGSSIDLRTSHVTIRLVALWGEGSRGPPWRGHRADCCGTSAVSWSTSVWSMGKSRQEGSLLHVGVKTVDHTMDTRPREGNLCSTCLGRALWAYRWFLCVGQVLCHVWGPSNGPASTYVLKMLTKWFQPSRLETRTKESNICASGKVCKTLARNESKGKFDLLRWDAGVRPCCTIDRSGFF
jgi:hypothetical protein